MRKVFKIFAVASLMLAICLSCSKQDEDRNSDINKVSEQGGIVYVQNVNGTGFNATIDDGMKGRSSESCHLLLSLQKEGEDEVFQFVMDVEENETGGSTVSYYLIDYGSLGSVYYNAEGEMESKEFFNIFSRAGRLSGESYGDCVTRLADGYEYNAMHSGLGNRITYKMASYAWDLLFIATAAGCCHYGC